MGLGSRVARALVDAQEQDEQAQRRWEDPDARAERIPYDASVWQRQENGDFIHTKTGEIRTEDQFDFDAAPAGAKEEAGERDPWDMPQIPPRAAAVTAASRR